MSVGMNMLGSTASQSLPEELTINGRSQRFHTFDGKNFDMNNYTSNRTGKKRKEENDYTIAKGEGWGDLENKLKELEQAKAEDSDASQPKFGTWNGVFVSCLLNIFGVIMFLRLPWTVGQAGILLTLVIIFISNVVTTITTLSMSAICTNGAVKAGGAYYLISRSLGPRVGGPIGVMFSLGQAVAVALYVIGFCETVVLLSSDPVTGDDLNDIRVFGIMVVTVLLIMAYIGTGWVIKLQIGLLGLLVGSITSVLIGSVATPPNEDKGFVGPGGSTISDNAGPEFRDGYDFFQVFAVFFPAVTGIMAGANISGDLINPSENIPKGTLYAIMVSTVVYMAMAIAIGAVVIRAPEDSSDEIGLYDDPLVMVEVAIPYIGGPLVLAGIFAATFSSGLASLVGAPRILMSVAQDDLIPALAPFGVYRQSDKSPVRGYFLTYFVSGCCILIGSLNAIAPLISMFFMITYGLINLSTFALEMSKSPSWRPKFTYFNKWVSFFGFLMCLVIMFLTSWYIALASIFLAGALYYYIHFRDPNVNWGSANQAREFYDVEKAMMRMRNHRTDNDKLYRPHYLIMTGEPKDRLHLCQFIASLRKGYGITVYGNVYTGSYRESVVEFRKKGFERGYYENSSVPTLKVRGFLSTVIAPSVREGLQSLLCCAGLGVLRPNTLVLGYKEDWKNEMRMEEKKLASDTGDLTVNNYVDMIRDGFKMGMGVMVCRNLKKLEWNYEAETTDKTIDIYWLVDDGGLTLLIPYILSLHVWWQQRTGAGERKVPLQLILVGDIDSCNTVQTLVDLFRIPCKIKRCPLNLGKTSEALEKYSKPKVVAKVREESKGKLEHWLKIGELIQTESKNALMVFVTLPYPLVGIEPELYMKWLDALSTTVPTVLIRGNNENVLTFYLEGNRG
eukprot:jgi/Bigna1/87190/estExt_fgenesh1_pg.C_170175